MPNVVRVMEQGNGGTGDGSIPQPPSSLRTVGANVATAAGVLLMVLGYGYQAAADKDPDSVKGLGGGVDWAAIAGAMVTIGSLAMHHGNMKDSRAAMAVKETEVEAAKKAPPINGEGEPKATYTASVAAQQALGEKKFTLARMILDALENHENPVKAVGVSDAIEAPKGGQS